MSPSIKISSSRNIRSFRRIDLVLAALAIVVLLATALMVVRGSAAADDPDCATLPSGLIGWWPGNGNANDIQGPTFENGVLENGATFAPGKVGQAFSFNGELTTLTLPQSALKEAFTALSVDAWVYPLSHGSDWVVGIYGRNIISNTDGDGFGLRVKDGYIQADLRLTGGNVLHTFNQSQLPLNAWSHVALTYNGSVIRAYLNGVEVGSGAFGTGTIKNVQNVNTCTMIGNEPEGCVVGQPFPAGAGFGWHGLIDEVDVFDRALSLGEIQAIYAADSGGKCHTNSYAFSANSSAVNEGDSVTITVTRSGIIDIAGSVDYTTSNIGATAGVDYTAESGTLNFAPGETSQTFQVQTLQDNIFEGVEDLGLALSNPTGGDASLGAQSTSTILIQDDDSEPTLSINDITQDEGNSGQSDFVFTVSLSNPTTQTATVDYVTADGIVDPATGGASCGGGTDYVTTSGTLTFNPGEVSKSINVPVCGDLVFELHETFTVTLANPADATISSGTGTGTITNDDAEPTLAIDDVTQNEGDSGEANFGFTLSLSHPSSQTVNVNFSTNDGTATGGAICAADTDYVSSSGTVTLNPGETSKPISVSVCGETVFEVDETFTVILDTPSNASIATGTGTGTITNDDAAPSFAIDNVTENEGDSGTTNFVFTVTKTGSTALSSSVDFATQDGTATVADNDYAAQTGTLNFGPTDTTMQITVVVNGDTTFEPTEAFTVQLSNPSNATISGDTGTGTITNDDAAPSFAIDNVNENEGDSGTTNFVFTVTKTGSTALSSSVDFATQDGTATVADNDYAAQNGTLNFGPTDTTMQITVVVNGDTTFEPTEAFSVQLSNPSNATISGDTGTGTITNDDAAPSFAIDNVTENEGDSGTTNFVFTVTKTGSTALSSTVDFATQDGTATVADNDYAAQNGTLNFGPTDTTMQITVVVNGDTTFEPTEAFTVQLSNPSNATISGDTGTGTITNDDAAPSFAIDNVTENEGDSGTTNFVFTVTKTGSTALSSSVDFATQDGTATTVDNDYAAQNGTLNFGPTDTTMQITVVVNGDTTFEPTEAFTVQLSNAANATISGDTGTGTITNDDAAPSFAIDNVTENEGDSGTTNFVFTVTKTGSTALSSSVNFATQDGTATVADNDYAAQNGTLNFGPTDTTMQITVVVNGDTTFEPTEAFTVQLSNAANATISGDTGTGTITNDDAAPSFAIDNVTENEGDSGTTNFVFTVTKTGTTALSSSVDFATQDGTATVADNDYAAQNGTLNFGPTDTTMQITVVVNGDTTFEPTEAFTVQLSNPSNATISGDTGTGTITNDDAAPSFAIDNVTENEGDSGTTNFVFTVTKTGTTALSSSVDFATQDGTATVADNDYAAQNGTLNFGPTDTTMQITVVVNGDTTFEPTEAFTVQLSNPSNATISGDTGTGTITNDDAAPSFAIDNVTENEGDSGTTNFVFTVTKTGSTALSSSVDFATQDGTATVADNDYQAANGTLTFGPAETSMQVTVLVNGDITVESNEAFTVNLSNPTEATISVPEGTGTIVNDDTDVSVSVSPSSVVEDEGTNLVYTFTRVGVTTNSLTINFSVGGTATFGTDYVQNGADTFDNSSGTATFPAGDSTVPVTIDPSADDLVETDEDVVLTVIAGAGYNLGTPSSATGTITDDETCPSSFTVNDLGDTGDANLGDGICDDGTGKCSLRAAIEEANALTTCGPISTNFAVNGTISLNGTELVVNHDLFINGPTGSALIISGSDASRIFTISAGRSVAISSLTLTGGNGSAGDGGAVLNNGTLTIGSVTLSGNSTSTDGGAISNTATLTISNSTISGNVANGSGGGINNAGTATLTNVTITNNRADVDNDNNGVGGGLNILGGQVTLRNTIVAGNFNDAAPGTTADDVSGTLDNATSFSNLIGDGTAMTGVSHASNGNQVGTSGAPINPLLGLLADNGGATQTHALSPASPALDAGDNSFVLNPPFDGPPFNDQRGPGFARIADGPDVDTTATVDIGAFEAHPSVSDIADQVTDEDVSINSLQFNVGDTGLGITSISADSDNPTLVQSLIINNETTATPDLSILLNADQSGQATITVTVTGSNGQSMSDTFLLTVNAVNDDPTTTGVPSVNVNEDSVPTVMDLANFFNDVEDGSAGLVYTVQSNTSPGLFSSVGITGTILTLEYAPNAFGVADITVRASDSGAKSVDSTFSVNVAAVNDPPTANGQAVVTDEDTPKAITLTGSDPENDALTFIIVTGPSDGVLSGAAPDLTYTPNLNYNGPDSFTFKVNDGAEDSGIATVSITVNAVNDLPVANAQAVSTDEDTPVAISLTGSDVETPSNSLVFTVTAGPANGTLSGTAPNLTYTPDANFNGADSFTFKVNDGEADSADATIAITVNPVNDPPTANAQAVTTDEDVAVSITLTGSDVETAAGDLTFTITAPPAHGTISGTAPNVTYTPDPNYNGADTFKFTVTDTGDGSAGALTSTEATVSITVNAVNDAPKATNDNYSTHENTTLNLAAPGVLDNDTDVENDSLTATLVTGPSNAASFTLNANGSFNYTPATGFSGTDSFTYKANDGVADSNIATVTITVDDGGTLQFSAATYSVNENVGDAVITITRTNGNAGTATVLFSTSNGTATTADYTAVSQTITFDDGEATKTVNVPIINDLLNEGDETVNLTLSNVGGSGQLGSPATAVLTIVDDDSQPSLSINNVSVVEGDSGTTDAVFTVTLSAASSLPITVDVATADGTAAAGSDYQAILNNTLTFNPGDLTRNVIVKVIGDVFSEPDETFLVNLTGATNATISDAQGVGTILNDDAAGGTIRFLSNTFSTTESSGSVTITVERGGDTTSAVTVDYATADDSESQSAVPCSTANGIASSRCDFTSTRGTLRFGEGETSRTFTVLISQDSYVEGLELLTLTLSNPTGDAVLGAPSSAMLEIADDTTESTTNPNDDAADFVRQHYHDFLNREPDPDGFAFWTNEIASCGSDIECIENKRVNVSAAYFLSIEFQQTGYLVHRFYNAALDRPNGLPRFLEFLRDTQEIRRGVVVGASGWEAKLEENRVTFADNFVLRPEFIALYPLTLTPTDYVDALYLHAGINPSDAERQAAIDEFVSPDGARGRVLRRLSENETLRQREFNRAFILAQYFGYLRRNPDDAPDGDFAGYNFWLDKLNQFNGNFVQAEMVKGFLISTEYRHRFGQQ